MLLQLCPSMSIPNIALIRLNQFKYQTNAIRDLCLYNWYIQLLTSNMEHKMILINSKIVILDTQKCKKGNVMYKIVQKTELIYN